jgi:hypothetical protein
MDEHKERRPMPSTHRASHSSSQNAVAANPFRLTARLACAALTVAVVPAGLSQSTLQPHAAPLHCDNTVSTNQRLEGRVLDPSGEAISGALVRSSNGQSTLTDADGRYVLACLPSGPAHLTIHAQGFANSNATAPFNPHPGPNARFDIHLAIARVDTDVEVGDDATSMDPDHGIGTHTLTGKDIQELADDPDDFKRELQVLAAANGGAPGAATITVDGFQNGSALPPKSSIARIVTAPDMFSTEYQEAPYSGGRIEIYTKPGAKHYHGALFYTDSNGSFNANDPYSVTATPAGKRRYGFELTGPIRKKGSDFNLALEKRDIDEFNVVNAVTLDANQQPQALHQTVAAPQRLWIASARSDWQPTPTDIVTLSFSANVNNSDNQGVGGLTLLANGYDSHVSEYDLRLTNTQTINLNLLHETRIGYTWKDTAQSPLSSTPGLSVAGFFNGGGNTSGNLNTRERDLELDDDVLYTRGRHSFKIGTQSLGLFVHEDDPVAFNGGYSFGGNTAPVLDINNQPTTQTTQITGLEQYRRALLSLPGGTPTTYTQGSGTALVPLTQWQMSLYLQDTVKLTPRFSVSGGLRYTLQSSPSSYANFAPRLSVAWAVDKQSKTVIHFRAGLFQNPVNQGIALEAERLNGTRQNQLLVYSPSYTAPLTPIPGSVSIGTRRVLPASFAQNPSLQTMAAIEHDFPHHWHPIANIIYVNGWAGARSRNINAPLVASSNNTPPNLLTALAAPRPIAPNLNIFAFEETSHISGPIVFLGLDQHSFKRFGFFAGYLYFDLKTDAAANAGFVQDAYSNQGERARPDWQATHRAFAFGNYNLPWKGDLSVELDAQSGLPYNVTTGTDNNGDGNFNDRPSYATIAGTDVFTTRFGMLTPDTVNGNAPRNLGTMPSLLHLDVNLSRKFTLGGKDSDRSITFNARSANLVNHTNVTAVSTVVSSPTFSQSLAAESARRIELGARFAF